MSLSITLTASEDNLFQNDSPDFNHGASTNLAVGEEDSTNTTYRSAIKFAFGAIPRGSKIVSATFSITAYGDASNTTATLNLYKITSTWAEGTITWNNQPTSDATVQGTTTVANGFTGTKSITVDSALVEGWYKGTITNYGYLLKNSVESNNQFLYRSKEYSVSGERPSLTVVYNPPVNRSMFI